jgi:hypothetical protein
VKLQSARKPPRRKRRRATHRLLSRLRRGRLGRIRLGTAGPSPRLRRVVLAVVLLGVAFLPYPTQGAVGVAPPSACRFGCRGGSVASMVRWIRPLPGSWNVVAGLGGTVPTSGLAYASVGDGVAAVATGLTVYAYSASTGASLWQVALTGFPAGAAIVSVRTWPGEVTAGVRYQAAGHLQRTEVVISRATGNQIGRYPAATFGGAVAGNPRYTVIVGATAVTSYDNATRHIRWQRPTGQVAQAWRTDGTSLYVAESAGGFVASTPVTGLRKINLGTGDEVMIRPLEGLSFPGTLSAAFDGVVLFTSASWVTAYSGTTGAPLWSIRGAVPEGTDPQSGLMYLTEGSNLIGVSPLTGRVKGTASGSAVNASAGVYAVRAGVALGLDQGASGDAWGYDIAGQRVTLAAAGLAWPHYFVDLSGLGGSADAASSTVIIAACAQLAPNSPARPTQSATPTESESQSAPPGQAGDVKSPGTPATSTPSGTPSQSATPSQPARPSPDASPSPTPGASQGCLRPELVALSL